jgi:riboflavin kinase/FMN adenylyltransferase
MDVISQYNDIPVKAHHALVALGNFDGLHKGHQVVLSHAKSLALQLKKPFGVMTFEPHPRSLFFPETKPYRITPPLIKRRLLKEMGVDVLFEIPFTKEFSFITAHDFIHNILINNFKIAHAVAGHDFVFGYQRGGDIAMLNHELAAHAIDLTKIEPVMNLADQSKPEVWSSTNIRHALEVGDMHRAMNALGRPFAIEGLVEQGDQRGRAIGFPTANVALLDTIRPHFGVYAAHVHAGDKIYKGVANIGRRPSVGGLLERLEVHLFEFSGDLYGMPIRVDLLAFLRDEQVFASLDQLKKQITLDCQAARDILGNFVIRL